MSTPTRRSTSPRPKMHWATTLGKAAALSEGSSYRFGLSNDAERGPRTWPGRRLRHRGAGPYGCGLVRHLSAAGEASSRSGGRAVSTGPARASPTPLTPERPLRRCWPAMLSGAQVADGSVEMIRTLRLTRETAVRARSVAVATLQSVLVTAPDEVRQRFVGLTSRRLVRACAQLASSPGHTRRRTRHCVRSAAWLDVMRRSKQKPRDSTPRSRCWCAPGPPSCWLCHRWVPRSPPPCS